MNGRNQSWVYRRRLRGVGVFILACGSSLGVIACGDLLGGGPTQRDFVLTSIGRHPSATLNLIDSAVVAGLEPGSYVYWMRDSFTFRPDGTGDRHESSRQYISGSSIGEHRFTLHNTFRYEVRDALIKVSYDSCERWCDSTCRVSCRTAYQNYDNLFVARWGALERRGGHHGVWHYEPVGRGAP